MRVNFIKMVGSGNDFIVINNMDNIFNLTNKSLIKKLCDRINGIGADGVILLEKPIDADFKMRIFNSDGSEAEMCGNGARCTAYFAYSQKLVGSKMKFETLAGIIESEIDIKNNKNIKIKMINPHSISDIILDLEVLGEKRIFSINTGVPHAIVFVDNIESVDVDKLGRFIRYNLAFQPNGTNVNFVKIKNDHEIIVRTYERGVEGETLSCGSGSTASALISALEYSLNSPVLVNTKSGEVLKIYFDINNRGIKEVYLEGFVYKVFYGSFDLDGYFNL